MATYSYQVAEDRGKVDGVRWGVGGGGSTLQLSTTFKVNSRKLFCFVTPDRPCYSAAFFVMIALI